MASEGIPTSWESNETSSESNGTTFQSLETEFPTIETSRESHEIRQKSLKTINLGQNHPSCRQKPPRHPETARRQAAAPKNQSGRGAASGGSSGY